MKSCTKKILRERLIYIKIIDEQWQFQWLLIRFPPKVPTPAQSSDSRLKFRLPTFDVNYNYRMRVDKGWTWIQSQNFPCESWDWWITDDEVFLKMFFFVFISKEAAAVCESPADGRSFRSSINHGSQNIIWIITFKIIISLLK